MGVCPWEVAKTEMDSRALQSDPDTEQIPRVFLSFASEDAWWVELFTKRELFGLQLGNVRVENYIASENLSFGELRPWIDKQLDKAAVVIAFVSEFYRKKQWTLEEWQQGLTEYQRRRLIFVPIMLDAEAKAWWATLRESGGLSQLGRDYQFSDFTDNNGSRLVISQNDGATCSKIVKIAQQIRKVLELPVLNPESGAKGCCPEFVLLGHPTGRFSDEIEKQSNALDNALRRHGLAVCRWKDGWRTNTGARLSTSATIFVQPLEAGDAADQITNVGMPARRLADAGIADARVVLWLPHAVSDTDFEMAAASSATKTVPALPDPWPNPALRNETPEDLANWVTTLLVPAQKNDGPLLQIETVGSPEGCTPDSEASRLSDQLTEDFCSIVRGVVAPERSSPWKFWGDLFKEQIAILPGSRAIVAVHDLDVTPSPDTIATRKAIELKFQKMQSDATEILKAKLGVRQVSVFWTALILRNAKALPFADYPSDGRYKDWRLLRFERKDGSNGGRGPLRMKPDPASLAVFRARLSDWATS
jgi:hypothetical protein